MRRLILILIALVPLISGCSRGIQGEAFIVTKDRSTIKLSLLDVYVIPYKPYVAYISNAKFAMNTKIESGRAQIAEAQKHVERLEIDIIGLEIDASRIETQEKPVMEEIYALNRAIFEVKYNDRLDLETRNRGVLSREEKVRTLEVKVAPLVSLKKDVEARIAYTQKNIEDQKSRIIEMKSAETAIRDEFLNGFTKIEGALLAKTNSEGQFHIRTRRGSYAIFANTDRRVGDEVEHYVWVIESAQEFVSLNNDNILK